MKFITNKEIENLKKDIQYKDIEINNLREELRQGSILEKLVINKNNHYTVYGHGLDMSFSGEISLTDDVAIYVPDILGGKVLKQEGTKCIKIDNQGKVTEGLTKQKPDKGFNYKLIREK